MNTLCPEILEIVFSYIPLSEVCGVATVCKEWNNVYKSGISEAYALICMVDYKIDHAFLKAMKNKKKHVMKSLIRLNYSPRIVAGIMKYIIYRSWSITQMSQHYDCIEVLEILYGDNLIADYDDSIVLHYFATKMHKDIYIGIYDTYFNIIKFLIDRGANPTHRRSCILRYFCNKTVIYEPI